MELKAASLLFSPLSFQGAPQRGDGGDDGRDGGDGDYEARPVEEIHARGGGGGGGAALNPLRVPHCCHLRHQRCGQQGGSAGEKSLHTVLHSIQ